MVKKIFSLLLLSLTGQAAYCQPDTLHTAKNLFYLEVGGQGGFGSINYERLVYHKHNFHISGRLGISTYNSYDFTNKLNPDLIIPVSIHGYYGKKHKAELAVGPTYANIVHADAPDYSPTRVGNFHTNFLIGYRYQKESGGFMFRAAYTPYLEYNKEYRNWAGISFGYSF